MAAPSTGETEAKQTDPVKVLVGRLDLEKYKATIKGLTQFGDRRQGTDRNRAAVDWIEAAAQELRLREYLAHQIPVFAQRNPPPQRAAGGAGCAHRAAADSGACAVPPASIPTRCLQPDEKLRALDTQPTEPGEREEVYCTKVGSTHPEEMYIVGGHMDGHGWGEAANDDGSGTALVMELARVFSSPDVKTERSIRFALWNNEETGLNGARAYVDQRAALQGKEEPPGSGRYPEPKWLGMIQHDMMLFDHGMPRADGTVSKEQRPEADVNIEFQSLSKAGGRRAEIGLGLLCRERGLCDRLSRGRRTAHDQHRQHALHGSRAGHQPARERARTQIGAGWDPQWHQPTDVYATYSDADFRLGLNAAQTTLGAIGRLAGAELK